MSTSVADPLDLEIPSPTVCVPQFETDDVMRGGNNEPRIFVVSDSTVRSCLDRTIPSRQSAQDNGLADPDYCSRRYAPPTESEDNYLAPIAYRQNEHQEVSHSPKSPPSTPTGYYYNQVSRTSADEIILDPNYLDVTIPHSISAYADNGHFDLRRNRLASQEDKRTDNKLGRQFMCQARSNLYDDGRRKEVDSLDVAIPHTVSEFPERASNEDLVYRLLSDKFSSENKQPTCNSSTNKYDKMSVFNPGKDTCTMYLDVVIPSGAPDYLELDSQYPNEKDHKAHNGSDRKTSDDMIVVDSEFYCPVRNSEYAEVDPAADKGQENSYQYIQLDKITNNKQNRASDLDETDSGVNRPRTCAVISPNVITPRNNGRQPSVVTPRSVITSSSVIRTPCVISSPVVMNEPARKHANNVKPEKRRPVISRRLLYLIIAVLIVISVSALVFIIYSQTKPMTNLDGTLNSTRTTTTLP